MARLAAKGEASLGNGDVVLAYQCLSEALNHLRQDGVGSGEYPPQNVWWAYAQICQARSDEPETQRALREAYNLVKAKADQIGQPEWRRSYLENVQVNTAIVAEMALVNLAR